MLPHLQHATAVNFHLADRERRLGVAQAAVNLFCNALFFADRSGRVVYHNQAAHKLLEDRDGLRLRNHQLMAADAAENRALQLLFEPGAGRVCCAVHRQSELVQLVLSFPRL